MPTSTIIIAVVVAIVGIVLGFVCSRLIADAQTKADSMKREAELEARDKAIQYKQQVDEDNKERMHEIRSAESRVAQREESLDRRSDSLDNRENQISAMQEQLEIKQDELIEAENEVEARLEKVAGMTPQQAKEELLETIRDEVNHDSAAIIRESEARTKAEADKKSTNDFESCHSACCSRPYG
jgi:ribonuclease Y